MHCCVAKDITGGSVNINMTVNGEPAIYFSDQDLGVMLEFVGQRLPLKAGRQTLKIQSTSLNPTPLNPTVRM